MLFNILTWKCASCYNGVHFFNISTSKSAPNPSVFYTFDFEMCFAPQPGALFRHLNFKKCSEAGVVCTFWLRNVLGPTKACTFSTSQLQKVLRSWCGLCILTWTCALHHNGIYLLTSQLPKVVRDRQFLALLTWTCASRHTGVHFLDVSTSKSGPNMRCSVHFDLEMCFAPQRHAIFHLSSGQMSPYPPL